MCGVSTPTSGYAASLGRSHRCRRNMGRTPRAQSPRCFHKGGPSGQHIIDQQAADPVDAGQPPRPHPHRMLEVRGPLAMVEAGLIGDPAGKHQGRRYDNLAIATSQVGNSGTGHQLQRRVPAAADSRGRRRNRNDEHRPVAARQDCPEAWVAGKCRGHGTGQHRRQNHHEVTAVTVLECHQRSPRRGVIRGGSPGWRIARGAWRGKDRAGPPRLRWWSARKGGLACFLRAIRAPG
jgi:hypothetical protein